MVEGTWMTVGNFSAFAAALMLGALTVYLVLSWRQDREERTRPEHRRWVTVESNAVSRRRWSAVGLGFTITAILVVVILAMLGV